MAVLKRLLVLGGTGYVGRRVCQAALSSGYTVTSISRHGKDSLKNLLPAEVQEKWHENVTWLAVDAANASAVQQTVTDSDAIVHAIGTLLESKFNWLASGSQSEGTTYERTNKETVLSVVKVLEDNHEGPIKPVVFVSAKTAPPLLSNYLKAKKDAEAALIEATEKGNLRAVIFRPGVICHKSRPFTLPMGRMMDFMGGRLPGVSKSTNLDMLVAAILQSILSEEISGVVSDDAMEALAQKGGYEKKPTQQAA